MNSIKYPDAKATVSQPQAQTLGDKYLNSGKQYTIAKE